MIKRAWYRQAANRSSDFVSQLKKKGRKSYIKDEVWDKWTEYWKTPEAIKKLEIFSKNRRFERGGEESGLSLHTGGSISALDTNNTSLMRLVWTLYWGSCLCIFTLKNGMAIIGLIDALKECLKHYKRGLKRVPLLIQKDQCNMSLMRHRFSLKLQQIQIRGIFMG
ncbi:uncharacterized protein LOC110010191 [Jatropha curcas]|uniref:uncharacterized protein LOC110010191 n=1 Tax=Jatropha curcas TaxID=180498 RepID=UPI0009D75484|nr:uncharacterized protein LOC110010191 [Jatropha curcas]